MVAIRPRLLIQLLSLSLSGWLVLIGAFWVQIVDEVDEIYDAHLAQAANDLLMLFAHEYEERRKLGYSLKDIRHELDAIAYYVDSSSYTPRLALRIWADGSEVLWTEPLPELPPPQQRGFGMIERAGAQWRTYVTRDAVHNLQVQVAEHQQVRHHVIYEVAAAALYPALVVLPLLVLSSWWAVGYGLQPLQRLAAQVRQRSPDALDPISEQESPRETLPLVTALNRLLQRLDETLERERRFTADASHELRTPLASLRIQAQVAQRCSDPEERQRALDQVIAGADRATHLIEQLLLLARLDPQQALPDLGPIALTEVAAQMISQLYPTAAAKQIDLALEQQPAGTAGAINGQLPALQLLLRNLIDNAIRYTPEQGQVVVTITQQPNGIELQVADSGPGIAPELRQRVLERFYRVLGSGASGSGLGLSIVARIAELHQATLQLDQAAAGGLVVRLRFPSADCHTLNAAHSPVATAPNSPPHRPSPPTPALTNSSPPIQQ